MTRTETERLVRGMAPHGVLASLALSLAICTGPATAHAADDGLITKPSKYSVKESHAI
jgi:hypothetical protein